MFLDSSVRIDGWEILLFLFVHLFRNNCELDFTTIINIILENSGNSLHENPRNLKMIAIVIR
jgi:hypothetical protein